MSRIFARLPWSASRYGDFFLRKALLVWGDSRWLEEFSLATCKNT